MTNATLVHTSSVTFAANLQRTPPTGRVLHAGNALTPAEARDLARRLNEACDRLDVLIAANTPEARAA